MTMTTADFEFICELVHRRSAIVVEPEKRYLVESRLSPLARAVGAAGIGGLVTLLRGGGGGTLPRDVVEAMTTNETTFFRDRAPFEALRTELLPTLTRGGGPLRVWCAAASSGQEPVSVAMLLDEHFPAVARSARILATDISEEMLERCRQGRYSQLEVNRGLPAPLLVRYFTKEGTSWVIDAKIRERVDLRAMNLAQPWPALPPMDVIFLRNVLIYFNVATKQDIIRRACHVLRPGGYLFLGSAETTIGLDVPLERVALGRAACYRRA
jgi:chemotaxis protein methyltransferase CheR